MSVLSFSKNEVININDKDKIIPPVNGVGVS
jgi:hypothetical protein